MPKKNSSWGVNTKAADANERKAEKKRSEQEAKKKAIEDSLWKDDDKLDQKKKERKEKEQQKKLETVSRKQESRELLEQEERTNVPKPAGSTSKGSNKKVTLSEIDKIKELERKKQQQRNQQRQKEKSKIVEVPELETENPNRKMAEMLAAENAVEARCVEDALTVLNVNNDSSSTVDKHPEKRMKAAYNEFEQRELPILKQENPNLRLSQLKQILHKQWQKSPDNPMNN